MILHAIPVLHMTSAVAAEEFYCGLLGFQLEFEAGAGGTQRDPCYLGVSRDGALLHLSSHAGDGVVGNVALLICRNAGEIDALHDEFVARGVRIHVEPVDQTWGMREMYVLDPDGNSVRFAAPIETGQAK